MLRRFHLRDTSTNQLWGFARPLPGPTLWGALDPLRSDPLWVGLIPLIEGAIVTDALHGKVGPLLERIREPADSLRLLARFLPDPRCAERTRCIAWKDRDCRPGKKVPACFVPIGTKHLPPAQVVIGAWREGWRVFLVGEGEFVPGVTAESATPVGDEPPWMQAPPGNSPMGCRTPLGST